MSKLVGHWVDQFGVDEVRTWFFEVWNEPNLKDFGTGGQADYFKLYRYTVDAIKAIDSRLGVGGPATAKNEWISDFLDFCERNKLPADFVSTHHYPTDALGTEEQDTETQLAHSRRNILRDWARETRRRARGLPVYYTEWNTSSNPRDPLHDEPYAAAFVTKTVMEMNGLVECYSFWTFSDIFEENYFPSVPFHGGFGLLNLHGIPKPMYRAFELLHRVGNECLPVAGMHSTVDAWVIRRDRALTVLLTNHALPRHPIETTMFTFNWKAVPRRWLRMPNVSTRSMRIRSFCGRRWARRSTCVAPKSNSCKKRPRWRGSRIPGPYQEGAVHLDIRLPPHAVAAITVEFDTDVAGQAQSGN